VQTALAGTALLMGLVGGPHCVAMCGAACAGVFRVVRASPGISTTLAFHGGRVAGYAAAGAVAAIAVRGLELAGEHVAALRPLWVLLHAFVLAWGLMLAVLGRQPMWAHGLGRSLTARLRPLTTSKGGVWAIGALWVSMPCGLLYSALLLAGLANGPLQGALAMALFALGSGMSLLIAPWLWERLRSGAGGRRREAGTRIAGGLLAAVALQSIWMDLGRQIEIWCR
jgi:sulfite exporter TauE/SafE